MAIVDALSPGNQGPLFSGQLIALLCGLQQVSFAGFALVSCISECVVGSENLVDCDDPDPPVENLILFFTIRPGNLVVPLLILNQFEVGHAVRVVHQQLWADVVQQGSL